MVLKMCGTQNGGLLVSSHSYAPLLSRTLCTAEPVLGRIVPPLNLNFVEILQSRCFTIGLGMMVQGGHHLLLGLESVLGMIG